ncbi:hypothetical protein ACFHWD_04250 [Clostridium sp. MT-14]|uniref:hypothetical protein n=1 Tax=Clostridium sp. MT-14 TaxID=3348360 RepID=UPI0035F3460A
MLDADKKEIKLFICYSKKLLRFLIRHEMKYCVVGLNPNNYKKFFVFIKNDKLKALLKVWQRIKLINKESKTNERIDAND